MKRTLFAAAALVVASTSTFAGEGRTPIWEPVSIGVPGHYIVTRNIAAPAGPVIEIASSNVEIDLNGFELATGGGPIITTLPGGSFENVTVRNGELVGGDDAVFLDGRGLVVEDLLIAGGGASGIVIAGTDYEIRRNKVHDRGGTGIDAFPGLFFPSTGTIENNQVSDTGVGITVSGQSSTILRLNRVERTFAFAGIFVSASSACLISQNTVQEATEFGIHLESSSGCKLHNNIVTMTRSLGGPPGGTGIFLTFSSDNLLLDNVSQANFQHGVELDPASFGNHLERNVMNSNGTGGALPAWGLLIGAVGPVPNVYRGNTALGNPGPPALCGGFPATTDFCDVTPGTHVSPVGDNVMPAPPF